MSARTLFWTSCILSRLALIAFILTSGVGLMPDEAQYWTWSLFPSLGYYSKPPAIAWHIFLGTHLFGVNALGVRIFSLLLPIPIALLIKQLVLLFTSNTRAAYLTALAFILSPLGMGASLFATTDGGMLLFGLLAVLFFCKASPARHVGVSLAVGALWKWMIYALLIPLLLFNIFRSRSHDYARTVFFPFLTTCAFAAIGLLPSLLWNLEHNFATFRHVGSTFLNTHSSGASPNPLAFLLANILLMSPGFFLLSLRPLFSTTKNNTLLLQLIVATICGGLFFASFFRKIQGNWGVLGLIFLFPLMGQYLAATTKRWLFPAALSLSLLIQIVFFAGPYVGGFLLEKNPMRQGLALEQIPHALAKAGHTSDLILFSDRYQTVSLVWFYTQTKTYFFNISHLRYNQFSFWPGMKEECIGKNGLYVTLISPTEKSSLHSRSHHLRERLRPFFSHVGKAKITPLRTKGITAHYLISIPVKKYSGKTPEERGIF